MVDVAGGQVPGRAKLRRVTGKRRGSRRYVAMQVDVAVYHDLTRADRQRGKRAGVTRRSKAAAYAAIAMGCQR